MENAYKQLGLKKHASKEEVDRKYMFLMEKNKEEINKSKEKRKDLIFAYNMLNNNNYYQPFNNLFSNFFNNFLCNIPSTSNNDSYYYSKESLATIRDGKMFRKTRENNNGTYREFEEFKVFFNGKCFAAEAEATLVFVGVVNV